MAVLSESLKICAYLENLVKNTFGPCGLDIMLNSSSGKILITNSGGVIINSLSLGHPVANVIVDKLKTHNELTGDGCCGFILVLSQALREIANLLQGKSQAELKSSSLQTLLSLSKHFMQIQSELEFLVQPELEKISTSVDLNSGSQSSIKETLSHIIYSCLNGKFTNSVQKLIAKLLLDLITNTCSLGDCFYDEIIELIDYLPQWCIQFHGMPVHNSYIDEGLVIPRELSTGQDITLPKPGETSFTFVLLQCSLDCGRNSGKAEIEFASLPQHSKALLHNQTTSFSVLKSFKEQNIQLLISSESVSDMALHLCRQLGIAVIQMVPMETIDYICRLTNIQSICSVNQSDIQNISDNFKVVGCGCLEKIIGGQKQVKLCVSRQSTQKIYHIVLCAPTQGLLQQYCIGIQGALKCIKTSISASRKNLTLLPGCGSVDFVISQIFDQITKTSTSSQIATAFGVLSKAFLQIPRVLHRNSHQSGDANYMRVQTKMVTSWRKGILLGIDGKTGDVVDPHKIHIYEPYQGKLILLNHLLQCLASLLRIDNIIGVSCPSSKSD